LELQIKGYSRVNRHMNADRRADRIGVRYLGMELARGSSLRLPVDSPRGIPALPADPGVMECHAHVDG
jgi:hypothetical protein